jgi:hypothetical protein
MGYPQTVIMKDEFDREVLTFEVPDEAAAIALPAVPDGWTIEAD